MRRGTVHKLFERASSTFLGTDAALIANCRLHLVGEEVEPDFNLTLGANLVVQVDVFGGAGEFLVDLDDGAAIFFVESDHGDASVELLEVVLEFLGVGSE